MQNASSLDTQAGAAVYSPFVLKAYDAWVLGVSNRWAWQCSTTQVLLPFYREHLGARHLDVGVGTGYYLAHAGSPDNRAVALLDLNETSLRTAARRMGRPNAGLYARDVMRPIALDGAAPFDSISLFYLLHCLPGTMTEKADVFAHLKPHLAATGVLYGATILGDCASHNAFGRTLMRVYNRKGIFGNRFDTVDSLSDALNRHFRKVDIRVQGKVALFVAKEPG
ncbi:class I SAM-dependent methyltransferase [Tahibacter amnicola]|uniref:Class I SAM-dependent methyltransferase n=1 Tax=Tahibacter amnicola TaxID=2976241 RepID=A0ABY6BD89_9GAMM|nr:class I SAM-dependent methyltransferase [Tahibacter amnicola]UXI65877.1 class I SAM-dependent methyltransferase [Tahibacter amnicola]